MGTDAFLCESELATSTTPLGLQAKVGEAERDPALLSLPTVLPLLVRDPGSMELRIASDTESQAA
jgi:hypothetical protein